MSCGARSAIPITTPLHLNIMANDVRNAVGSPAISWFLEAAVSFTTVPPRHKVGLWLTNQEPDYAHGAMASTAAGIQQERDETRARRLLLTSLIVPYRPPPRRSSGS